MQIKVEELSDIINFYPQQTIDVDSRILVANKDTIPSAALCRNILELDAAMRILLTSDLISVKHSATDIETFKMLIMAEIDDYFTIPYCISGSADNLPLKDYAEALADAIIRPTLKRDKGDIIIHNIDNGTMEMSFAGHCAGCPYAQNTLHNVVAKTFMRYLPQITEIKLREKK